MSILGAFIVPHPPIILPEVGRGEEKRIQQTIDAYREVSRRIAELRPETVVVTSPHAVMYSDYFHISPGEDAAGDLRNFGVSGVSVQAQYDTEFVMALERTAKENNIPAGTRGERVRDRALDHGTLLPLRFLKEVYSDFKLVRIGLSGLSVLEHYRFGKCIAETANNLSTRTVFIASGDLSHKLREDGPYGFVAQGPEFDSQVTEAMRSGDFLRFLDFDPDFCDVAAECGLRSFIIMAGALDGLAVKPDFLSYEGTFGVGYGICAFEIVGKDSSRRFDRIYELEKRKQAAGAKANEDAYVRLARYSLEHYLQTGKQAKLPQNLPGQMLGNRAGVFVSLKKHGRLRGCIGTIEPTTPSIAEEILSNAISAGVRDHRFPAVTLDEMKDLVYSVDVLSEPEPIESISELDVKLYGVIVKSGHRRGLLLPNLEGINTPQEQVDIAMQKAGINKAESPSLERFKVVRHI